MDTFLVIVGSAFGGAVAIGVGLWLWARSINRQLTAGQR